MRRILSIDGGGIRGIIPGQILVALEKKLQVWSNDRSVRIADFFDFFAGTSTGGILVCLLLCPDPADKLRPRYTAAEAVMLYKKYGSRIFERSAWDKVVNYKSIFGEKYSARHLEKLLQRYLGNVRLGELLKPALIPSYDIQERKARFFTSHDARNKGEGYDFLLRDVCRAASAAPAYFETALVRSGAGVNFPMIDGGMFANNPTLCACSEIMKTGGLLQPDKMTVLSLGTGAENRSYAYRKAKDWGALGWLKPSIDIMMSGVSETTHYHMTKLFMAGEGHENYIRVQPLSLWNAKPEMDDASPGNIAALIELGAKTAHEFDEVLDRLAKRLVEARTDRDKILSVN